MIFHFSQNFDLNDCSRDRIELTRGDSLYVTARVHGGRPIASACFALCKAGQFGGTALANVTSFVPVAGDKYTDYIGVLRLNTDALTELIGTADSVEVAGEWEIKHADDDGNIITHTSGRVEVVVSNDYIRQSPPVQVDPAVVYATEDFVETVLQDRVKVETEAVMGEMQEGMELILQSAQHENYQASLHSATALDASRRAVGHAVNAGASESEAKRFAEISQKNCYGAENYFSLTKDTATIVVAKASEAASSAADAKAAQKAAEAVAGSLGAEVAEAKEAVVQAKKSETNAAASAVTAGQKATAAAGSATSAATSAGTATTKAGEAVTSAQQAQQDAFVASEKAGAVAKALEDAGELLSNVVKSLGGKKGVIELGNGLNLKVETVDGKERVTLETARNLEVESLSLGTGVIRADKGTPIRLGDYVSTPTAGDAGKRWVTLGNDASADSGVCSMRAYFVTSTGTVLTSPFSFWDGIYVYGNSVVQGAITANGSVTLNGLVRCTSSVQVFGDLQFARGVNGYVFANADSAGSVYYQWHDTVNNTFSPIFIICSNSAIFKKPAIFEAGAEFPTIAKANAGISFNDSNRANPFSVIVPDANGIVIGKGGLSTSKDKTSIRFDGSTNVNLGGEATRATKANPAANDLMNKAMTQAAIEAGGGGSGGAWDGGDVANEAKFLKGLKIGSSSSATWAKMENTNAGMMWPNIPADVLPTKGQIDEFVLGRPVPGGSLDICEVAGVPAELCIHPIPYGWYEVYLTAFSAAEANPNSIFFSDRTYDFHGMAYVNSGGLPGYHDGRGFKNIIESKDYGNANLIQARFLWECTSGTMTVFTPSDYTIGGDVWNVRASFKKIPTPNLL